MCPSLTAVGPFESEASERVSVSSKAYVASLHIGHTFASAAIDSPQAGQFFVSFKGWVSSNHSPQCLHFFAIARISSPQ